MPSGSPPSPSAWPNPPSGERARSGGGFPADLPIPEEVLRIARRLEEAELRVSELNLVAVSDPAGPIQPEGEGDDALDPEA